MSKEDKEYLASIFGLKTKNIKELDQHLKYI